MVDFETARTQWLVVLSLYAVVVRCQAPSGRQRADLACVSFANLAHPRFSLALPPPPLSTLDAKVWRFTSPPDLPSSPPSHPSSSHSLPLRRPVARN